MDITMAVDVGLEPDGRRWSVVIAGWTKNSVTVSAAGSTADFLLQQAARSCSCMLHEPRRCNQRPCNSWHFSVCRQPTPTLLCRHCDLRHCQKPAELWSMDPAVDCCRPLKCCPTCSKGSWFWLMVDVRCHVNFPSWRQWVALHTLFTCSF